MPRDASNSPGARALRLAGYVKSPSFWVTTEQYELILWMAKQNKENIERIREQTYARQLERRGQDIHQDNEKAEAWGDVPPRKPDLSQKPAR